ncbi:MAG TPA: hypothetical protein VLV46_02325 [Gaiellaceae bacterium]|nr:hypothetical protein [Gaiellaceae bacterium]
MRASWDRWAPLSGLVFAVLLALTIFVGGSTPDANASAAKVVAFYTKHHGSQSATAYFLAYGALFALIFAAALWGRLRREATSQGLLATGLVGGGVLAVGLGIVSSVGLAIVAEPGKISPAAEQSINVLSNQDFIPIFVGAVAFMIANGIAIAQTAALPRWLGWVAILIGIVAAIPTIGFFALLAMIVWVAIVGILLCVRTPDTQPGVGNAAPAGA